MNVVDIRDFYGTPLGHAGLACVADALRPMMQIREGQTVMGLGYATPFLDLLCPAGATALAFMLARQGVTHWPDGVFTRSALVDATELPLLESAIDHALVVHGLEFGDEPLEMLREIWRVLAPQGRLYLVVPNRLGVWSASDRSPFGHGQPFSRVQITSLLKESQYSVLQCRHALYVPPINRSAVIGASRWLERAGNLVATRFSGVLVMEAVKQVYAFSSGKRVRRFSSRLQPALLPAPRPSNRV